MNNRQDLEHTRIRRKPTVHWWRQHIEDTPGCGFMRPVGNSVVLVNHNYYQTPL